MMIVIWECLGTDMLDYPSYNGYDDELVPQWVQDKEDEKLEKQLEEGIRYKAEWLVEWSAPPDMDPEFADFRIEDQVYKTQICQTIKEAAKIASKNDLDGEGHVIVEEFDPEIEGQWREVERLGCWEI